jgi:hypothetical protein
MAGFTVRRTGADDYGKFIKALIAGKPGSGKTRVSATFPNPLIASAEGGLMSIADQGVPYVEIDSIADLIGVRSIMEADAETRADLVGCPVDTIVIDTIDTVQKLLVRERLAESKQDSMKINDWGWLGNQMTAIIDGFRSCDAHVVFTCHIKDKQDADSGRVWFEPDLQGAISGQIPGMVDLALVLQSRSISRANEETNEIERTLERYLQVAPTDQFDWVKDRSGKLPAVVPVDMETEFTRLFDWIFGGVSVDAGEILLEAEVEDPRSVKPTVHRAGVSHSDVVPEGEKATGTVLPTETVVCEVCSESVTEDQADMSKIKQRKVLCVNHLREAEKGDSK